MHVQCTGVLLHVYCTVGGTKLNTDTNKSENTYYHP